MEWVHTNTKKPWMQSTKPIVSISPSLILIYEGRGQLGGTPIWKISHYLCLQVPLYYCSNSFSIHYSMGKYEYSFISTHNGNFWVSNGIGFQSIYMFPCDSSHSPHCLHSIGKKIEILPERCRPHKLNGDSNVVHLVRLDSVCSPTAIFLSMNDVRS